MENFLEFSIIPDLKMDGIEKDIQKSAKAIGDKLKGLAKPLASVKDDIKKTFDKKPVDNFQSSLDKIRGMALKIGAAFMVKKGLGMASAFEQERGALDFAMGNIKDDMRKFIKDMNDKTGLGEKALTEMISSNALKMKGLGFEGKNLMKNLENISNMSLDMAGNWNIDENVASDLINQVMTGQTKGLQQYGIKMNEDDVKSMAKQYGFMYDKLNEAEKAQIRLNILTKKAKEVGVKGGYEDAKDSYDWLLKGIKGQGEVALINVFESMKEALIPALKSVLDLVKNNQEVFKNLGKVIGTAVGEAVKLFVKLNDLSKPLVKSISKTIKEISNADFSFIKDFFEPTKKIFNLTVEKMNEIGDVLKNNSEGFKQAFSIAKDVVISLFPLIEAVIELLAEVSTIVIKISNTFYEVLKPVFESVSNYIMSQIEMWTKAIKGVTSFLKDINKNGFFGAVKNVFTKEEKTEISAIPANREPTVNSNAPIFNETRNKTEFKPTNNINLNIDNNVGNLGEKLTEGTKKILEDYNKEQERRLGIA